MEPAGALAALEARLVEAGGADLLLAVLSYQHARTIGSVVRDLEKAVATQFPDARAAILHWDAGSTDGTVEAATAAAAALPLCTVGATVAAPPPVHGVPGGDVGFQTVCHAARAAGARAVLLVGADLRAVPAHWVERLVRPVWREEAELVAPLFARPVLDGPVTTCLLYPLTRALHGASVRSVVAGELALGGTLVGRLCGAPGWGTAASRTLPLFLATSAAAAGVRLGEVALEPRDEEPRELRLDLGDIMSEVVGSAFALVELYEEQWREQSPVLAPPRRFSEPVPRASETPAATQARMVAVFRQGLRDLQPLWEQALGAGTLADVYALGDLAPEEFTFPPDLWAAVVYDILLAWRFRVLHRGHLLRSLVPLYLGRMAGLFREAAGLAAALQERLLERQAIAFERARGEFVDRWR